MDLLKTMMANRAQMGVVSDPKPRSSRSGRRGPTKAERAKANTPGSKAMRKFIAEEKPSKKVVREHLEAMIEAECASSSDDE
jgi:hypothetical protein